MEAKLVTHGQWVCQSWLCDRPLVTTPSFQEGGSAFLRPPSGAALHLYPVSICVLCALGNSQWMGRESSQGEKAAPGLTPSPQDRVHPSGAICGDGAHSCLLLEAVRFLAEAHAWWAPHIFPPLFRSNPFGPVVLISSAGLEFQGLGVVAVVHLVFRTATQHSGWLPGILRVTPPSTWLWQAWRWL